MTSGPRGRRLPFRKCAGQISPPWPSPALDQNLSSGPPPSPACNPRPASETNPLAGSVDPPCARLEVKGGPGREHTGLWVSKRPAGGGAGGGVKPPRDPSPRTGARVGNLVGKRPEGRKLRSRSPRSRGWHLLSAQQTLAERIIACDPASAVPGHPPRGTPGRAGVRGPRPPSSVLRPSSPRLQTTPRRRPGGRGRELGSGSSGTGDQGAQAAGGPGRKPREGRGAEAEARKPGAQRRKAPYPAGFVP